LGTTGLQDTDIFLSCETDDLRQRAGLVDLDIGGATLVCAVQVQLYDFFV